MASAGVMTVSIDNGSLISDTSWYTTIQPWFEDGVYLMAWERDLGHMFSLCIFGRCVCVCVYIDLYIYTYIDQLSLKIIIIARDCV